MQSYYKNIPRSRGPTKLTKQGFYCTGRGRDGTLPGHGHDVLHIEGFKSKAVQMGAPMGEDS